MFVKYLMMIDKHHLYIRYSAGKINATIDRVDIDVEAALQKSVEHVHAPPGCYQDEIFKIQNCTKYIVRKGKQNYIFNKLY